MLHVTKRNEGLHIIHERKTRNETTEINATRQHYDRGWRMELLTANYYPSRTTDQHRISP